MSFDHRRSGTSGTGGKRPQTRDRRVFPFIKRRRRFKRSRHYYGTGLGPSIFDIKDAAPQKALYFPKTSLSAVREEGFMEKINALGKKQIIIAGIEEHICVLQTAVELKEKGFDVFVVTDASGSRAAENKAAAETRFQQENIFLTTVEMVLFEWLRKAGTPEFKDIQNRLIR